MASPWLGQKNGHSTKFGSRQKYSHQFVKKDLQKKNNNKAAFVANRVITLRVFPTICSVYYFSSTRVFVFQQIFSLHCISNTRTHVHTSLCEHPRYMSVSTHRHARQTNPHGQCGDFCLERMLCCFALRNSGNGRMLFFIMNQLSKRTTRCKLICWPNFVAIIPLLDL